MKPLSEQLVETKKALMLFDASQAYRDALIDKATTYEEVGKWMYANLREVEYVQDAFYEDCVREGIPNSLSHCRIVDIGTLKRWCAGEPSP